MKKPWKLFWIFMGLMLVLCIFGGGGYLLLSRFIPRLIVGRRDAVRPTVTIFVPRHGQQVTVASIVSIQVEGSVRSGQVVLLQLWADGELIGEQSGSAAQLNGHWGWMPLTPGDHTLTARAYNQNGDSGVTMVRVTAIEATDADRDGVSDEEDECPKQFGSLDLTGCSPGAQNNASESAALADAWISGSGGEVNVEAGQNSEAVGHISGAPGVIQGDQQRPSFDDDHLAPGQIAVEENCMMCDLLEQQQEPVSNQVYGDEEARSGVGLELEVLSLRTAEGLSDVSCYVRLQNALWVRAPDDQDQFLNALNNGFWNIADYLGGEHGQGVTIMEGDPLHFQVRCMGRLGDMLTPSLHLGEVSREHGIADWNGQTFTARGQQGGNWFDISYRICSIPCEEGAIAPPYDLQLRRNVGINTTYTFSWRWNGDLSTIDGFNIYRDNQWIDFSGSTFAFLSQSSVEPSCSEEYSFEVRAVKGRQESAPSNAVFFSSSVSCRNRNELTVANAWLPTQQRPVLNVELNYWYDGSEGREVRVFVLPLRGGLVPGWPNDFHVNFSLSNQIITPEQGSARVSLMYGGDQQMVTDGLRLIMMDSGGNWFYWRDVPLAVVWYPSAPDLAIISVDPLHRTSNSEYAPAVLVRNDGYRRLWWHPDIRAQHIDGTEILRLRNPHLTYIGPQETALIFWNGWSDDQIHALLGTGPGNAITQTGYEFVVDPDNSLAELNEENNVYRGSLRRLTLEFLGAVLADVRGERTGGVIGIGGQLFVRHQSRVLGALEFKGWAKDDWNDGLYAPHEEGITLCPGGAGAISPVYNFQYIFSLINGDPFNCANEAIGFRSSCGARIVEQGENPHCIDEDYPNGCYEGEDPAGICANLHEQGFAPNTAVVSFYYPQGEPLEISVYLYDVDYGLGGTNFHTICDFRKEISAEQIEAHEGWLQLWDEEWKCNVGVDIR